MSSIDHSDTHASEAWDLDAPGGPTLTQVKAAARKKATKARVQAEEATLNKLLIRSENRAAEEIVALQRERVAHLRREIEAMGAKVYDGNGPMPEGWGTEGGEPALFDDYPGVTLRWFLDRAEHEDKRTQVASENLITVAIKQPISLPQQIRHLNYVLNHLADLEGTQWYLHIYPEPHACIWFND